MKTPPAKWDEVLQGRKCVIEHLDEADPIFWKLVKLAGKHFGQLDDIAIETEGRKLTYLKDSRPPRYQFNGVRERTENTEWKRTHDEDV
ncbi:hypothetical protein EEAAV_26735 (plasmid) [Rahnella aceris]